MPKEKTIRLPKTDPTKGIRYMEFEPKIGKQHLPVLVIESNDLNECWKESVKLVRDEDLWDDYVLSRVGGHG